MVTNYSNQKRKQNKEKIIMENHSVKTITIRELIERYENNGDEGVVGFNGLLNIRPKYQREFVYNISQQQKVINSIMRGRPLNLFHWAKNSDGTYELLDGQQRTMSICQFYKKNFSFIDDKGFEHFFDDSNNTFLDYPLTIQIFEGGEKEKLDWFETINISGEPLTKQELKNSVYTGEWLTDAKKWFAKIDCAAIGIADKYLKGLPVRQDYLETVLNWISDGDIVGYMSKHRDDKNASELWLYFNNVINWVKTTFGDDKFYRKEMKGIEWGFLFNKYKDGLYDSKELESMVAELMENEEVTNKKGIYEYLLSGKDVSIAKKLSKRTFSPKDIRAKYEKQKGKCVCCKKTFPLADMAADHIMPWTKGGATIASNLQMLCKPCNATKSDKW